MLTGDDGVGFRGLLNVELHSHTFSELTYYFKTTKLLDGSMSSKHVLELLLFPHQHWNNVGLRIIQCR
jgi:hypothetical protein